MQLSAQNNYWTQQYGARATLTGGNCMSCDNDNSVFYYNPGAIGFLDSSNFNITSNLYGLDLIKLENAAGDGLDLSSNKLAINAQVLMGNVSFKKVPKLKLVYGYVLRNYTRFEFEQEKEMFYDVIPDAPGMEFYRGKLEFDYYNFEYWGGLTAGYQINEHISVGLGHYGGYAGVRSRIFADATTDAVDQNGLGYTASSNTRMNYKLDHFYILFKPGIDIRFGNYKFALAAMLPSAKIWGQGRVSQSVETFNLDKYNQDSTNALGLYPSLVISADQNDADAKLKLSPSISFGFEYNKKDFRLALTAEYFFPVNEYKTLDGEEDAYFRPRNVYAIPVVEGFSDVTTRNFRVINAGIGAEIPLSKKLILLSGFHTDFNNKIPLLKKNYQNYITEINPVHWHYLNYNLGLSLKKKNSRTFVGISYNQGFSKYNNMIVNYTNPSDDNFLIGDDNQLMKTKIHQVSFVIGHTQYLGNSSLKFKKKNKS